MGEKPEQTFSIPRRLLESVVDLGFLGLATLAGAMLLLETLGRRTLSTPYGVLIFLAWGPFFWGRYWRARREGGYTAWFVFACAVVFSAVTLIAVIVILLRLVGDRR